MVKPYWTPRMARLTGAALKRTPVRPIVANGVTFRHYQAGTGKAAWISDDSRCEVRISPSLATYRAWAGDKQLPQRFRNLERAMAAAVAALPRKEGE